MLVVEDPTRRFGAKAAVAHASFAIERGAFVGVIGRSGAGTLLRMINPCLSGYYPHPQHVGCCQAPE
jgi:ABC-type Na+ transport system ATPase subunit NatA